MTELDKRIARYRKFSRAWLIQAGCYGLVTLCLAWLVLRSGNCEPLPMFGVMLMLAMTAAAAVWSGVQRQFAEMLEVKAPK